MRTATFGGLECVITGGADRQGGGSGPIVILLHGFGAPGTDLVGLWRVAEVPAEARFVFPAAPLSLGPMYGEGRAWWPIDLTAYDRAMRTGETRDLSQTIPDGLAPAREAIVKLLADVRAELGDGPIVLGGFSQGAMLALDVTLRTEFALAGLVLFSGTLLAREEWGPLLPKVAGLRIVQSHGQSDQILPFSLAEELKDLLTHAGAVIRWVPFNGGHEIPSGAMDAFSALVRFTASEQGTED